MPIALAAGQALLCGVAFAAVQAGPNWVLAAGGAAVCAGAVAVAVLETPRWFDAAGAARGHTEEERHAAEPHPAAPVLARAQA